LNYALKAGKPGIPSGFEDVRLVHNSLPGLKLDEADTSCVFLGKKLNAPLLINAMTGGHPEVKKINRAFAGAARDFGIAMAVGSQMAGLEDHRLRDTYAVVREENPDGVILANVSAGLPFDWAAAAVEMVSADGLQLYLNVPQELVMPEGDRDFTGVVENIRHVVSSLEVPVIVKEVGFGISRETAAAVYDAGVRHIDVGGQGGTNFVAVEQWRTGRTAGSAMVNWGIPTAASLLEVLSLNLPVFAIASGGLNNGVDAAKALSLGAGMAGMAGCLLRAMLEGSEEILRNLIENIVKELRLAMLLTGASNLEQLKSKPVLITGRTAEWAERRGIDVNCYARR